MFTGDFWSPQAFWAPAPSVTRAANSTQRPAQAKATANQQQLPRHTYADDLESRARGRATKETRPVGHTPNTPLHRQFSWPIFSCQRPRPNRGQAMISAAPGGEAAIGSRPHNDTFRNCCQWKFLMLYFQVVRGVGENKEKQTAPGGWRLAVGQTKISALTREERNTRKVSGRALRRYKACQYRRFS